MRSDTCLILNAAQSSGSLGPLIFEYNAEDDWVRLPVSQQAHLQPYRKIRDDFLQWDLRGSHLKVNQHFLYASVSLVIRFYKTSHSELNRPQCVDQLVLVGSQTDEPYSSWNLMSEIYASSFVDLQQEEIFHLNMPKDCEAFLRAFSTRTFHQILSHDPDMDNYQLLAICVSSLCNGVAVWVFYVERCAWCDFFCSWSSSAL